LNALSLSLSSDIQKSVLKFDKDPKIDAIVVTGNAKAFAAGADLEELSQLSFSECFESDKFSEWNDLTKVKKPMIAAVDGFALGGGCELAMMCDIIIAGNNAKFSQPEVKIGLIPGWGGTQRLVRSIGKSKAMEMILTGDMIDAQKAYKYGLVSKVVDSENLIEEALKIGGKISACNQSAILMAKECVNKAFELSLSEGVNYERKMFHSLFALPESKEGIAAFLNKKK